MRRMKREAISAILALGLGVSTAAVAAPLKPAAKTAASDHPHWQQFCDDLTSVSPPNGNVHDLNARLRQLGNEGWELTGMGGNLACYKRANGKSLPAMPVALSATSTRAPLAAAPIEEPAPVVAPTPAPVVAAPAPVAVAASAPKGVVVRSAAAAAKPVEAKVEPKTEPKAEVKSEAKVEPKPESKPVAAETKTDFKQLALAAPAHPKSKAVSASTSVPASAKAPGKSHTAVASDKASTDDVTPAPAPGVRRALVPKS